MVLVEKEDLGLSLGLRPFSPDNGFPLQFNLMPPAAVASSFPSSLLMHKSPWSSLLSPSADGNGEARRLLRGIDVNRAPSSAENEEAEAAVSSPNSTISSVSGKRSEREHMHCAGEELEAERSYSREMSDDEDGGDGSRKKLRLSKEQAAVLEESFKEHNTLNPKQKQALAKELNLRPRQVEVWFQNRRARTKLKQTEVDCEYLKRCCENLTEENRRLQKEVQELRALKLSPHLYMHMTPPTTLTMCPSCERVAVSSSSSSSASSPADSNHPHHRPIVLPPSWAPLRPLDAPPNRT